MPEKKTYADFDFFEALYKQTRENTVIIMETDGTIAAVNSAFTDCFGYHENDIVGKNFAMLYTDEDRENGMPENELKKVQKCGQSNDNNFLVHKNNDRTWVSGESVLVQNKEGKTIILKIVQDIHKQKTSENSVLELNAFNENILLSIKDAVVVLDKNMHIVKTNPTFKALCTKSDEQEGDIAKFLKSCLDNHNLYQTLRIAVETGTGFTNKEVALESEHGNKKTFEITCTPMVKSDETQALVVMHDITVYKELEREREDIIGFITHELRNPLSNLMLSNDLMKEAAEGNEISFLKEMLDRSENNVHRMNKMITGLYEATKVNSGYFPLDLSKFHFGSMIKEAIDTIQALNPSFEIIQEGDVDFMIVADRYRIIQVITNYLSNAIKYSGEDKEIILTIKRDDHFVTVAVKDRGIGISKDHLPYLFERFFRLEKTRKIEGIGLGLYLCRKIIRSHKGRVGAESEENKGSVFYFTIPLNASENKE